MSRGVDAVAEWARDHLESWDRQQASYINRREDRFAVMLDVLAETVPEDALVVDLACGPGVDRWVLRRFPRMSCLAVDYDPMLLKLGRLALADGDRVTFREADLSDPTWIRGSGWSAAARGAVLDRVALAAGRRAEPGLPRGRQASAPWRCADERRSYWLARGASVVRRAESPG